MKNTYHKKGSFFITIAFFILAFSVIFSTPAPAGQQLIGPEGGQISAGHSTYLIVPEGALEDEVEIQADSFKEVLIIDESVISSEQEAAYALLKRQYDYIKELSKEDDSSDEWVEHKYKGDTLWKSFEVRYKVIRAWRAHTDDQKRLERTLEALDSLDTMDAHIDTLVDEGKMGAFARDTIGAYSNDIRLALELVVSLHYDVLVFHFGPHGTELLVSAQLVIPLDVVLYKDALFWYSPDGEVIDLIDLGYFVDEVNETVIFFIDHFSKYFFDRR